MEEQAIYKVSTRSKYEMQIEEEFGKRFTDVVLGYLNMGYSVTQTATILDMPERDLYRTLKRHSIKRVWAVSK